LGSSSATGYGKKADAFAMASASKEGRGKVKGRRS